MNISAHIFAILKRLVKILAFTPKSAVSIGKLKNGYHVLIAGNLQLLLVADARYMLEAIMLFSIMTGFDQRYKKVMDRSFRLALYLNFSQNFGCNIQWAFLLDLLFSWRREAYFFVKVLWLICYFDELAYAKPVLD